MLAFLARRLAVTILAALAISVVVFAVLKALPGDPAQIILGTEAKPENLRALREKLGLDRPFHLQYWAWLKKALQGDFGDSIAYQKPVTALILSRLPVTVPLIGLALLLACLIALPLGIYGATHFGGPGDLVATILSQLGLAIPAFWLGIILILVFGVRLNWLPAGGFTEWSQDPAKAFLSLLLPAITLGLIRGAALTRMTRSSVLDVLNQDYVATARSKGLTERRIVAKHVLKNSLISVLTLLGLQVAQLLAGAIVIENVFRLPGLGRLLLSAVENRDLQLVQGLVIFLSVGVVTINLFVDMAYGYLDPRIRLQ